MPLSGVAERTSSTLRQVLCALLQECEHDSDAGHLRKVLSDLLLALPDPWQPDAVSFSGASHEVDPERGSRNQVNSKREHETHGKWFSSRALPLRVRAMVTCPAWVSAAEESSSASRSSDSAASPARAFARERIAGGNRALPFAPCGGHPWGCDCVDDRLRNSASNFGWEPAKIVPLLRAEGDRIIAVVINPVAGPYLTILAVSRRNVISFWLWEELPNQRFRGHKRRSVIGSKIG